MAQNGITNGIDKLKTYNFEIYTCHVTTNVFWALYINEYISNEPFAYPSLPVTVKLGGPLQFTN